MKRILLILLGVTLVAGLGMVIDAQSGTQLAVTPGVPGGADLPVEIYAPGRLEGATREAALYPQLAGVVAEVLVAEGETVEQGAILFRLDDAEHLQNKQLAQAELALAEAQYRRLENGARDFERAEAAALYQAKCAQLEDAKLDLARLQGLRQNAFAQQEIDDERARVAALTAEVAAAEARANLLQAPSRADDLEIARARIDSAKAKLAVAEIQWERTRIRAPIAGQVLAVDVEPGEYASPNSSQPPVILADTGRWRVRAFVEELDAPRVAVGMTARVTADGLAKSFTGRVARLSPRMDVKEVWSDRPAERLDTKTREVWIELHEASDLVVGLRVDVMIQTGQPAAARAADATSEESAPPAPIPLTQRD